MATQPAYDAASMAGSLKSRYGKKLVEYEPPETKLRKATKFDSSRREGKDFNQMVQLTRSGGFTYAGASAITTAYDLNAAIPSVSANASVQATEIVGRENIGYGILYKAQGNDDASFVNADEYAMRNLVRSTASREETMHWWGGKPLASQPTTVIKMAGIGNVEAISGTSTTRVLTISAQSWAPAMWFGAETNQIDAVDITVSGGAFTGLAVINTNAAIVITAVVPSTRKISVSGNSTDLTALDTPAGLGNVILYWHGAFGNESLGALQILAATSGSLFGITVGTYSLWDPVQQDCGGAPLSFQLLLQAADLAVARGMVGDVTVYVPAIAWTDMMNDLSALRRIDTSYRPAEGQQGFGKLVFHGQAGSLTMEPSLYVKSGTAFLMCMEYWVRRGSTEITMESPSGIPFYLQLQDNAGIQIRAFAAEAMFCERPSRNVLLYNIGVTHPAS